MRGRALAGGVMTSAAIMVAGWQLGASQLTASSVSTSGTGTSASSSGSASAAGNSASSASGSSTGKVSGTFDGTTTQTQFGPVQVEIVVAQGAITDVKALQLTDHDGRSVQISNYAAPILRTEALSAQSASIQSVSGATYTSQGYITSLQSAIDRSGL
jgi:uncharacterized protein with FMN-binding domain